MTAIPSWHSVSDADLARAAAAGDRRAFAGIYDRYADRLHDFCVRTLGDRDAAADCVQDAFCVAATRLTSLREPERLRPWLYSIARHHAMRRLRDRYREQVSDEVPDAVSHEAGPDTLAGRTELADLIAEAAGGLSDRDHAVLELAYRHGLDGPELAEALGVSLTNANTMVHRLRETIERCLGALLVARGARTNRNRCPQLAAILDGWDGRFSVLLRKRIARHIESCSACEQERRRLLNPAALLGAVPVFIPAPDWLRGQTLSHIQLTSAGSSISNTADPSGGSPRVERDAASARHTASPTSFVDATGNRDVEAGETPATAQIPAIQAGHTDDAHDRRTRRVMLLASLFIGVPLICLGLTLAWLHSQGTPITPAGVSGTAPKPSNGAPGGQLPVGTAPNNPAPAPNASTNTSVPAATAPAAPNRGVTPIVTPPPAAPAQLPPGDTGAPPPPENPAWVPPTPISLVPLPPLPAPPAPAYNGPQQPPPPPPQNPPPPLQTPNTVVPPLTSVVEPPH